MLNKLQTHFPTSILINTPPQSSFNEFVWVKDNSEDPSWLGIPKEVITEDQLTLLGTLFEIVDTEESHRLSGIEKKWHDYLFHEGSIPPLSDRGVRIVQFHVKNTDTDIADWDKALKEFFTDASFIWLNEQKGLIIQDQSAELSYDENDFSSISTTLENDFFIKTYFYIGKTRMNQGNIREAFLLERKVFTEGMALLTKERIFTYEKVFPALTSISLASPLKGLLETDIVDLLRGDEELLETMKVFLENGSNATLAAKKLYIHRNTLQYRLDKFTEQSSINVKVFSNALTVYLACLIAELTD
ncbi:PucR C-terminal helix-turn-helix domain-containing protein [Mesobacillus persicus]|uniref:PucR C-terminal helix-turn-helix domain-containing protein n=1 Tax=Mesobacillus persicus TaxID=930146 RepID=A0A1H8DVF7_9BACI|nr:helix-turn-helix domain-containing protein [Mesobacillus persicus]SEN11262.1 PucR C-terminal helix-turn-helix domain-containing protein [Mesobacillus persicus]